METEVMNMLKVVALAMTQYREFRSALAGLRDASDQELARAGLDRGDVVRAAFETAERRVAPLAATTNTLSARRAARHPAIFSPARA